MIIEKVRLNNFRQFKNFQEIEFSNNTDSNITLILGDNTSGKSTLLQSFLWCLYNRVEFDSKDQLYNLEKINEMIEGEDTEVEVTLVLEHQGAKYEFTRKQKVRKSGRQGRLIGNSILVGSEKSKQGITKSINNAEELIKEILPEDLSSYFFYDTERFGNISHKKDLTESVKGLLGLSVLEKTIEHMGTINRRDTVLWKVNQEINQQSDQEIRKLSKEQEELERNLEHKKIELRRINNEIENYKNFIELDKNKLKNLEETMSLQKERDTYEKQIEVFEKDVDDQLKNIYKSFHYDSISFFASPIIDVISKELKDTKIEENIIRDMNANSIEDIIKRGRCLCGAEIVEGDKHYHELIEFKKYLPPESINTQVGSFLKLISVYKNKNESHYEYFNDQYKRINEIKGAIATLDHEIRRVSSLIEEDVDGEAIENRLKLNTNKLAMLEKEKIHTERDIEDIEKRQNQTRDKYNRLIVQNEQNKRQATLLEYGNRIVEWLIADLNNRQETIKNELQEKVSEYFQKIYHGERYVQIDEKFNVSLTSGEERQLTDESAGLQTVKNFSFISGLVTLAKNKLMEEIDFSNEYPLVLDAPFSNVDEKHVLNISKVLPQVTEQLILIVMSKDWNYASEQLEYRVGKKYELVKLSETNTVIKEVF